LWALLTLLLLVPRIAHAQGRVEPGGIPVRFAEGTVHGFLDLHNIDGRLLANGDLLQTPSPSGVDSRMVFHFADGSVFEETVKFTQHKVFELQSYHLVQRGPAFTDDLDASFTRDGKYLVKSVSHKDHKEKQFTGTLDLPADVSNGLVPVLLKNLIRHDTQSVHMVAFMPKPRLVGLRMAPVQEEKVMNGTRAETTVEYDLKPRPGAVAGFLGGILGEIPADTHMWIVLQDVPAFVRSAGPLYTGPIWRISLTAPR
jgi:hypothetical protein